MNKICFEIKSKQLYSITTEGRIMIESNCHREKQLWLWKNNLGAFPTQIQVCGGTSQHGNEVILVICVTETN